MFNVIQFYFTKVTEAVTYKETTPIISKAIN